MFLDKTDENWVRQELWIRFKNLPLAQSASISELEKFIHDQEHARGVIEFTRLENPRDAVLAVAVIRGQQWQPFDEQHVNEN